MQMTVHCWLQYLPICHKPPFSQRVSKESLPAVIPKSPASYKPPCSQRVSKESLHAVIPKPPASKDGYSKRKCIIYRGSSENEDREMGVDTEQQHRSDLLDLKCDVGGSLNFGAFNKRSLE
ncbi:hypothetical protein CDAR_173301 [Caerostris darwini]|uniref:Uncharacterized protein n=1 Tax=Caerostris darwini TaxID=1538125 RepID=A0AAV4WJP2_9ARAC|nr:hypothetical protein CDAR_173301 [Caerostris darwini]